MAKSQENFSVLIRAEVADVERHLYRLFSGHHITASNGEQLIEFRCTDINQDGSFLAMQVISADSHGTEVIVPIRVPSQYVFFIVGDKEHPASGFTGVLSRTEDEE